MSKPQIQNDTNQSQTLKPDRVAIISSPGVGLAADFLNEEASISNPGDQEYIQVCGGCGHRLAAYHAGYTAAAHSESTDTGRLAETLCPQCFNANFRHTSPIATRGYIKRADSDSRWYKETVIARADRAFWYGELVEDMKLASITGKEPVLARKDAISRFDYDWSPKCPACRKSYDNDEFDFHHWDYETDRGCMLCRDCHNHVHRGLTATGQADEISDSWLADAIERLYCHSSSNGIEYRGYDGFLIRFNIPQSQAAIEAIEALEE